MIIKNAAYIFDLLANNLSRSKAFETIEYSNERTSIAGLVLVQSRTVTVEKCNSKYNQLVFF